MDAGSERASFAETFISLVSGMNHFSLAHSQLDFISGTKLLCSSMHTDSHQTLLLQKKSYPGSRQLLDTVAFRQDSLFSFKRSIQQSTALSSLASFPRPVDPFLDTISQTPEKSDRKVESEST